MPEPEPRPETERYIFAMCKGERTRKKAKNAFSKEEAGTCGNIIVTKRFSKRRATGSEALFITQLNFTKHYDKLSSNRVA